MCYFLFMVAVAIGGLFFFPFGWTVTLIIVLILMSD